MKHRCRGRTIQIGSTIELFAQRSQPREATDVADVLMSIARDVLPAVTADVVSRVLPFDGSERIGPETAWLPEVRITIEVTRHGDCLDQTEGVECDVVREIERRLRAIGLNKRH